MTSTIFAIFAVFQSEFFPGNCESGKTVSIRKGCLRIVRNNKCHTGLSVRYML